MELLLANPRGFCAGVDRAIAIVERALALHQERCPVARSIGGCIAITTSLAMADG